MGFMIDVLNEVIGLLHMHWFKLLLYDMSLKRRLSRNFGPGVRNPE